MSSVDFLLLCLVTILAVIVCILAIEVGMIVQWWWEEIQKRRQK